MYTTIPKCAGFLLPTAIFILVILSALAGFMSMVYTNTSMAYSNNVASSQAYQALRAGSEWALYQITQNADPANPLGSCKSSPGSEISLNATSLSRFTVTVDCEWLGPPASGSVADAANESGLSYGEGFYKITVWACNAPLDATPKCPGNAASENYVERSMSLLGEK